MTTEQIEKQIAENLMRIAAIDAGRVDFSPVHDIAGLSQVYVNGR